MLCMQIHKKFSGITGRITKNPLFVCSRCQGSARPIDGRPSTTVLVDGVNLNVEPSFCYLGDMLSSGGGCEQAIKAYCCVAWSKFRKLLPPNICHQLLEESVFHFCHATWW